MRSTFCSLSRARVATAPKGFNPVEDMQDSYKFLYPFGWQEVAVNGADVVYKDVVEPLESVSVTLTATDKNDITEFGDLQTVSGRRGGLRGACMERWQQQQQHRQQQQQNSKYHSPWGPCWQLRV